MTFYNAVFPVNGNTREISHVLIGAGQLVEKSCFSAVLISYERKRQDSIVRERIAAPFRVEFSAFTKARMLSDVNISFVKNFRA